MDVHTVARAGYDGLRQGKILVVPGLRNKVGAFGMRFMPRSLIRKLVKSMQS